mgnify:CR=1 FL=1
MIFNFENKKFVSITIVSLVVVFILFLKIFVIMEYLDLKGYDFLYRIKGNVTASDKIVFVDIADVLHGFPANQLCCGMLNIIEPDFFI